VLLEHGGTSYARRIESSWTTRSPLVEGSVGGRFTSPGCVGVCPVPCR
jgi:hypothetical protein